ncbi:MAG: hypothetical protein DWP95_03605 [Proteobacteria bacterium]|nr:MAG: hypothetical protein DWP95_03605 [Pseudomonadota bacterium]
MKGIGCFSGIFYVKPDWSSTSGFFSPDKNTHLGLRLQMLQNSFTFGLVSEWQAGAAGSTGL